MLMTNSEIMNAYRTSRRASGFNLTELFIVIGVIAFLAAMVIPALYSAATWHGKKGRILCVKNLKEIGVTLRSEASQDPMQVVLTNSETMKRVTNGSAYLLWQTLSNSLESPTLCIVWMIDTERWPSHSPKVSATPTSATFSIWMHPQLIRN